jgi:hypothetical protein
MTTGFAYYNSAFKALGTRNILSLTLAELSELYRSRNKSKKLAYFALNVSGARWDTKITKQESGRLT